MDVAASSVRMTYRIGRRVAALLVVLVALIVPTLDGGTAHAHTDFESSTPADGAVVDSPVEFVTIVFTGDPTPVDDAFVALDATGVLQQPVSVETLDDRTFELRFDPPLTGGQVGIRWNVQSADAHRIAGAFSFTVTAPAPTSVAATTTPPPATPPPGTVPATTVAPETTVVPFDAADEERASTTAPADDAVAVGEEPAPQQPTQTEIEAAAPQSLDDFLAVDNSRPGETLATIGRLVGLIGIALGLGAFAFVAVVLRGRRDELRQVLLSVRALGALIAIGAATEYVGVGRIAAESIGSTWSSAPGFATVLRILGGIVLATGVAGTISAAPTARREERATHSLSAAVADDVAAGLTDRGADSEIVCWRPSAGSWTAFGGVTLLFVSFWFDGHTVSKGFRPLHALVNSVHVAAGSVWVGGVVVMAALIWRRSRSGRPTLVIELILRFSKVATVALATVVVAGGVMAFFVLDSFGELTGTPWGKLLLLKTAGVGVTAIVGAYNHFRLLPALESEPESPAVLDRVRSSVTAEAIMLLFVVTVTAWLVTAAS